MVKMIFFNLVIRYWLVEVLYVEKSEHVPELDFFFKTVIYV
jgi:hypothetical protein